MKRGESAKKQIHLAHTPNSPRRPQEFPKAKFRAVVKMKKPWVGEWLKKPDKERVLEAFADEILYGEIDDYFEITVNEQKK